MMNQSNITPDDIERDTLLLESLMEVVPHPGYMATVIDSLENDYNLGREVITMLKGYGTLINILQAASELHELLDNPTLHARLSAAYYELTNNDPPDDDTMIRLRDDD